MTKNDLNNLQENVLIMVFFDATVFSGFLAFDLNTYSHSKNIFILEPIFRTLDGQALDSLLPLYSLGS